MHYPTAYLHDGKWSVHDAYAIKDRIKAAGGKWHPDTKTWELGLEEGKQVLSDRIRRIRVRIAAAPDRGIKEDSDRWFTVFELKNDRYTVLDWGDDHFRPTILEILQPEGM